MNKKILLIALIPMLLIGLNYTCQPQETTTITKTQNYLTTPYLANPANLETQAELTIITIGADN